MWSVMKVVLLNLQLQAQQTEYPLMVHGTIIKVTPINKSWFVVFSVDSTLQSKQNADADIQKQLNSRNLPTCSWQVQTGGG